MNNSGEHSSQSSIVQADKERSKRKDDTNQQKHKNKKMKHDSKDTVPLNRNGFIIIWAKLHVTVCYLMQQTVTCMLDVRLLSVVFIMKSIILDACIK